MVHTRKGPVFLGFLSHAVTDGSVYIVVALLPFVMQSMHLSYGQAGLIWTVANLAVSIPQPFFGIISDRTGNFSLAAGGLAVAAIALAITGYIDNYYVLLLFATLGGIGGAIVHPIGAAIVAAASGAKRGTGMSMFALGGNTGFALAPLILPPLLLSAGTGISWVLFPIGALTAIALFFGTRGLKPVQHVQVKQNDSRPQSKPLWPIALLIGVVVLRSWVYTSFIAFLPMFLNSRGISLEDGSRVLSLVLILGAVGSIAGGILSDSLSAKWVTFISMILLTIILVAAFETTGIISIVLLVLSGGVLLTSFAVTVVMAQKVLPRQQALASGLMLGFGIGLGGVGTGITGWLIDVTGMHTAMLSLAIVALFGALSMLPYREKEWHQAYGLEATTA